MICAKVVTFSPLTRRSFDFQTKNYFKGKDLAFSVSVQYLKTSQNIEMERLHRRVPDTHKCTLVDMFDKKGVDEALQKQGNRMQEWRVSLGIERPRKDSSDKPYWQTNIPRHTPKTPKRSRTGDSDLPYFTGMFPCKINY
jgi:hypothetical protein